MARYNITGIIKNATQQELEYAFQNKGKDDNITGGDHGSLYHGELTSHSTRIKAADDGSFAAKSVGNTVQGSVNYYINGDDNLKITLYFHSAFEAFHGVKDTALASAPKGYDISCEVDKTTGSYHPTMTYTLRQG